MQYGENFPCFSYYAIISLAKRLVGLALKRLSKENMEEVSLGWDLTEFLII